MGRRIITFELRSQKDDDIAVSLSKLTEDRSDIIRAALRRYFEQAAPISRSRDLSITSTDLTKEKNTNDDLDGALDNLLHDF